MRIRGTIKGVVPVPWRISDSRFNVELDLEIDGIQFVSLGDASKTLIDRIKEAGEKADLVGRFGE